MNEFLDEVDVLVNDIINHDVNLSETQARIDVLKNKYGEDSFPSINFEKKAQPWDEAYLKELKVKNVTGACSEEFLIHMAEVSDYLSAKKQKSTTIAIVTAIVAILIIILVIVL